MAINYKVIPSKGLIYIRYSGIMGVQESREAMSAFMRHPSYQPGLKQLINLSEITDWERDYTAFMMYQAEQLELFKGISMPTMMVCIAPTQMTQQVAAMVLKSWDVVSDVISVVVRHEDEALQVLGLGEPSLAALLQTADTSRDLGKDDAAA